ncbi:MAG: NERD domain-containing protein [Methylophilaceae bacterium]
MIFKENNNSAPIDKFEKAGYDAERKVAFYLKMAFGENPDLLILNDLRVESGDITAQMDHLAIHQHGIIIIESKSVAGKLQVQDDGQWIRWYAQSNAKDKSIGMPNPIKQAKIQGQTLMNVLSKAINENARSALKALPVDVLVAFSNHNGGVFIAKDKTLYPEVCPADAIDDKVNEILAKRAKNQQDFSLSETNRDKLANYLIKIDKPYQATVTATNKTYPKPETQASLKVEQEVATFTPTEKPNIAARNIPWRLGQQVKSLLFGIGSVVGYEGESESLRVQVDFGKDGLKWLAVEFAKLITVDNPYKELTISSTRNTHNNFKHTCHKCKSDKLEVRFGKNYYFKCLNCDENNRIDATCTKCKSPLKIRKDKSLFYAECKKCNSSELFHSNS